MALPSEVFRRRMREVRRLKGWTQQQLASALAAAGTDLGEPAVTRMERGTRGISLDEAMAIAAVLGVSPLHLFVPLDNDEELDVAPAIRVAALDARAWVRGQTPLRSQDDDRLFYSQTPERDWDAIAPRVAERFTSREDFEAHRAKWEREVLYQLARDTGGEVVIAAPADGPPPATGAVPARRVVNLRKGTVRVEPTEERSS